MTQYIGIVGNGGQADEAAAFFDGEVVFRAVTNEYLHDQLVDVDAPSEQQRQTPVVIAVGAPQARRALSERWPGDSFASVVSDQAYIDRSSMLATGCIIAPQAVITTNVTVGSHTIVNVGASIQHNSTIGSFVTIGPGVRIGGNVTVGDGVFIGIGAIVKNGVHIAHGVVVGAGAVVIDDLETTNGVYVGVPAKLKKVNEGWLREI